MSIYSLCFCLGKHLSEKDKYFILDLMQKNQKALDQQKTLLTTTHLWTLHYWNGRTFLTWNSVDFVFFSFTLSHHWLISQAQKKEQGTSSIFNTVHSKLYTVAPRSPFDCTFELIIIVIIPFFWTKCGNKSFVQSFFQVSFKHSSCNKCAFVSNYRRLHSDFRGITQ